tara:strand:+ start:807 stop:1061 length:255 start_codon:yes stop_codon:yes gene_type:complete
MANNKKVVLKQLADYFSKKGKIMTVEEYKAATDVPMRFVVAKRPFGSWGRMMQMCKVAYPEMFEVKEAPKPAKAAPKKAEKKAK